MPAESANTVSLVPSRLRPSVAHAASLSFMASRRRPSRPRRMQMTSSDDEREDHATASTICDVGLVERVAEDLEWVDVDRALLEQVHLEPAEHLEASAALTPSGRARPRTRRCRARGRCRRGAEPGSATSAPTAAAISTAQSSASGSPPAPRWAMTTAPMPAKLELAQRDLAREPDERDERERHDADREDLAVGDQVRGRSAWWP